MLLQNEGIQLPPLKQKPIAYAVSSTCGPPWHLLADIPPDMDTTHDTIIDGACVVVDQPYYGDISSSNITIPDGYDD